MIAISELAHHVALAVVDLGQVTAGIVLVSDQQFGVALGLGRLHGNAAQARRWVVERKFAWLMRYRRLVRDDEQRLGVSTAMIYLALGSTLLHRIRFR